METDETNETESVEVSVEVTPPAPEPADDGGTVVVVESAPAETGDADVTMAMTVGALVAQVAELTERVDKIDARAEVATSLADSALARVDEVAEEAAEVEAVVTEVALDTVEEAPDSDGDGKPDVAPDTARTHWLTRSWGEWRNR